MLRDKTRSARRTLKRIVSNPGIAIKTAKGEASLKEVGIIHGTDKVNDAHTFQGLCYMDIYEKYLKSMRDDEINLLEIGVREGESMKTWEAYFKNGNICGLDIDPRCKAHEKGRVKVEIGSQDDPELLKTCFGEDTEFDVIIDDGSHVNIFTIASFESLFEKRLKSGGIYIVEDLAASYKKLQTDLNVAETWPGMKYNEEGKSFDNDREDLNKLLHELIRSMDFLDCNVLTVQFWSRICVIIKA
jgi:hypothetical protein